MDLVKILKMESGSWASPEDVIGEALKLLDNRGISDNTSVYAVYGDDTDEPKTQQLVEKGPYLGKDGLKNNLFCGCDKGDLVREYDIVGGNATNFSYILVLDASKLSEKVCNGYQYIDPTDKKGALTAIIEIDNTDLS